MPITMIHEKVASLLSEKYPCLDSSDFYLGMLAPDAKNLNGLAPKEERWTAHLRDKSLAKWKENIKTFYETEKSYPHNFLLGYYLHIYTDIVVDELFYQNIMEKINHPNPQEEYVEDMERYSNTVLSSPVFQKIKSLLQNAKTYSIKNISKNDLDLFKEKYLKMTYPSLKPKYITDNLIIAIAKEVEKEYLSIR